MYWYWIAGPETADVTVVRFALASALAPAPGLADALAPEAEALGALGPPLPTAGPPQLESNATVVAIAVAPLISLNVPGRMLGPPVCHSFSRYLPAPT